MGDKSPSAKPGSGPESPAIPINAHQGMMPDDGPLTNSQGTNAPDPAAFQGQYQQILAPPPNQFDVSHAQMTGRSYDMGAMINAFMQQHQRYHPVGPNMMPQMAQSPGQHYIHSHFYHAHQQQIPQPFNASMSSGIPLQPYQVGLSPPRAGVNMGFYPPSLMMGQSQTSAPGYFYPTSGPFPPQNHLVPNPFVQPHYFPSDGPAGEHASSPPLQRNHNRGHSTGLGSGEEIAENRPSIVRGPPRKPRQSGHAIWIGNLPPQTNLLSLVHHVCQEATGLESLFLISKSNCAFANFKDETSCTAAQQKLHDSNFQSVRLVSRLRKSTVEGTSGQTAPTGPAAISSNMQSPASDLTSPASAGKPADPSSTRDDGAALKNTPVANGNQLRDKFFILKSLTVEDLELSVQNGVWATQSHNEEALNEAFTTADNVYLIFSANKSGEYFGYARMASPINHDPAAAIQFAPKAQTTSHLDLPKAIPTEATETCPRGRIIDDSARGTIFWEADREEGDGVSDTVSEHSESARSAPDGEGTSKTWGKPFKLEWLSTTRLPFYRTRGLRNPWNSNREVKIARDGTELEPAVGRKLIGLFNRIQSPVSVSTMGIAPGYLS